MRIYTRSGDKGETSLYTGVRVPKNDPHIVAVGDVDECNSAIGLALSLLPENEALAEIKEQLIHVQHALFDVGAAIATPRTSGETKKVEKTRFSEAAIKDLENWIDEMQEKLPPLKQFILPGGHPAGAALHVARSLCRQAERTVIPLKATHEVSDKVAIYLNRLSDYLFVVSRYVNLMLNSEETPWKPYGTELHRVGTKGD
ncbi:MAG: cob(I)yrinic acid a,c-diamide adenosyltransferase [Chlamydiia bacterium]|nr:cob(I)yrinic acid a,c-diamide adenosyltransferase [Chlamydiia bacterium]